MPIPKGLARPAREPLHEGVPAVEYVARMQTGTASWIDPFTDQQLADLDREVHRQLAAYCDAKMDQPDPAAAHPARHLHR